MTQATWHNRDIGRALKLLHDCEEQEQADTWLPECATCGLCGGFPFRESELKQVLGVCGCLAAIGSELNILQEGNGASAEEVVKDLASIVNPFLIDPSLSSLSSPRSPKLYPENFSSKRFQQLTRMPKLPKQHNCLR